MLRGCTNLIRDVLQQEEPGDLQSKFLFGDDLRSRMDKIKGDTSIVKELEKRDFPFKKRPDQQSNQIYKQPLRSNWQTPLKTQSGSSQGYQPKKKSKYQNQTQYNQNRSNNNNGNRNYNTSNKNNRGKTQHNKRR